ncbi:hypothetical protein BJV77DRAFT_85098 [Russula vinacea]|nr:hypothetical protein BJV77DRAFT_85098 [Russula vinacea]
MYLDRADEDDKKITQRWKGECDAILIFTGLFSAALAALLAVSVQGLQPGPQDSSAFYLKNIYYLLANSTSSLPIILPIPSDPPKFSPPKSAILVNSLWFLSLVMSLTGALLAVFIQQWAQSYLEATQGRHSPKERARIRVFHAEGLENLYLNRVTRAVPILIHISLFLFFSGLPIFLFNVNRTVFNVVVTWLALCVAATPASLSCRFSAKIAPTIHHFLHRSGGVLPTRFSSSINSSRTLYLAILLFSGGTTNIMRDPTSPGRLCAPCKRQQGGLLWICHRHRLPCIIVVVPNIERR